MQCKHNKVQLVAEPSTGVLTCPYCGRIPARYLSLDEQDVMHRALRASGKVIGRGKDLTGGRRRD